ncbi:MAG: hypothetical protein AAGC93_24020 [Cyanobacteria bacterium P01_F01_bin.53]
MKQVLNHIQLKKQAYEQLPFFNFVRDSSIDPLRRLAWAPYAAPFIMGFIDLNKYVFRVEPTEDPLQEILNRHTYEDDRHWRWFLEDLQKLGFDKPLGFNDALQFFWGEETKYSRELTYQFCRYGLGTAPIQKAIAIETIEAAGNVQFSAAAEASRDLQTITGQQYKYFGDIHLSVETGRTFGSVTAEEYIENIQLTPEAREAAFELVDTIFSVLTSWKNDLFIRAQAHPIEHLKPLPIGVR